MAVNVAKIPAGALIGLSKPLQKVLLALNSSVATGASVSDLTNTAGNLQQSITESTPSPVAQYDNTPNRSFGTAYQNTSKNAMTVAVTGLYSGAAWYMTGFSDTMNPPATTTGIQYGASAQKACLTFVVPVGNYYQVTCSQAGTVENWLEWY